MAAPDTGPCQNWPVAPECFNPPQGTSTALQDFALQVATEILWRRSGRRYGLCTVTLRPCKRDCLPAGPWLPMLGEVSPSWQWPFPALVAGAWMNIACGCRSGCSCTVVEEVRLPYPVAEIVTVTVDGSVLPSSAYRVDDWRMLVRLDGGSWPRCNDLTQPDTEAGTWSVEASYGEVVPSIGSLAVAELTTEVIKSCMELDCQLPAQVSQVARQGVSVDVVDAQVGNRLGLRWVDEFLQTVNPKRASPAAIYDIDGATPRRAGT